MSTSDGRRRGDAMIPRSLRRCCFARLRRPASAREQVTISMSRSREPRGLDKSGRRFGCEHVQAGPGARRLRRGDLQRRARRGHVREGRNHDVLGVRGTAPRAGSRPRLALRARAPPPRRRRHAGGPQPRRRGPHVHRGRRLRRRLHRRRQRPARADTGAGVRGVPRRGLCGDDGFARRHRDDVTAFAGNPPLRVPHPSLDADDSDRRLTIVTGVRECPVTPLRRSDGDWVEGGEAMRNLHGRVVITAAVLVAAAVTLAAQTPAKTFVAVLSPEAEVPACAAASNAAGGSFVAHVVDEATGAVEWKLVANNLPGTIVAAHIHLAPKGVAGPIVQPLPPTPGDEHGVIGTGTFTNPALVAGLRANPDGYYVNVHTTVCPAGAARGQLGDHGPGNN